MTDLAAREREVVAILDGWDWSGGACLVGGYAASAYGKPRYSEDLDLVIPVGNGKQEFAHLLELGFTRRPRHGPDRITAFRDLITFESDSVSVDLMMGYAKDQVTGVTIPGEWIARRSRGMRLVLVTGSTRIPVRVCRPEALWVLKILPGRDQDLSDLFAISSEPVNVEEIRSFLASVSGDVVRARFEDETRRLETRKIYSDSLSARFLPTASEDALRSWDKFRRLFHEIVS